MPKSRSARKQMLNTVCQNTHAKNQMLKKCKSDLSSNQHTEKVMKYIKKLIKEKSEYVTVLKQFKTNEFQSCGYMAVPWMPESFHAQFSLSVKS